MYEQAGERIDNQTAEVIEIRNKNVYTAKYLRVVYCFSENHKQHPYHHGCKHVVCQISYK
jgi:hypothetical protein